MKTQITKNDTTRKLEALQERTLLAADSLNDGDYSPTAADLLMQFEALEIAQLVGIEAVESIRGLIGKVPQGIAGGIETLATTIYHNADLLGQPFNILSGLEIKIPEIQTAFVTINNDLFSDKIAMIEGVDAYFTIDKVDSPEVKLLLQSVAYLCASVFLSNYAGPKVLALSTLLLGEVLVGVYNLTPSFADAPITDTLGFVGAAAKLPVLALVSGHFLGIPGFTTVFNTIAPALGIYKAIASSGQLAKAIGKEIGVTTSFNDIVEAASNVYDVSVELSSFVVSSAYNYAAETISGYFGNEKVA